MGEQNSPLFLVKGHVSLVDGDVGRRASLSNFFGSLGLHVEPYDGWEEFATSGREGTLIAVFDEGQQVEMIFDLLVRNSRWTPIIAYSDKPDPSRVADVVLRGAIDYFALPFDWAKIQERMRLNAGNKAGLAGMRRKWTQAQRKIAKLSRRERQVLDLLMEGNPNKAIARALQLSPRTVEIHRSNMMNKLDAHHSIDAVRIAVYARIYDDPEWRQITPVRA